MVRVIGRINGQLDTAVMLNVDMNLDPIEARQDLVKEAAAQLQPEAACPSAAGATADATATGSTTGALNDERSSKGSCKKSSSGSSCKPKEPA